MKKILIAAIALIILCLFSFFYFELPFNLIRPVFHTDSINRYAAQYGLDPLLITSIVKVESNFLRRARSSVGAIGLMQLLPSTARELGPELGYTDLSKIDLENPDTNIRFGSLYIKKLSDEFDGNMVLAIASYNAGKTKVRNWYIQNPLIGVEYSDMPYKETRNYVNNVMRTYQWLQRIQKLKTLIGRKKTG
jgi:soluble lytic murein transglycosylase